MPVQDKSSPATIGDEGLADAAAANPAPVVGKKWRFRDSAPSAVGTLYKEQWTTLMAMADEIAGVVIGQDWPRAPRQSGFGPTTSQW